MSVRCLTLEPTLSLAGSKNLGGVFKKVHRHLIAYADLAAANALTGHEREAHAAVAELRRLRPNYTVALWLQDGSGWSDNVVFLAEFQRIAEGLRKAGLPE